MRIIPGDTFEKPAGTFVVTSVGDEVTFDQKMPDGTVIKDLELPLHVFCEMVASPGALQMEFWEAQRGAVEHSAMEPKQTSGPVPAAPFKPLADPEIAGLIKQASEPPEITPGQVFEGETGKRTVVSVENGKVTFDHETPAGDVFRTTRPLALFQKIAGTPLVKFTKGQTIEANESIYTIWRIAKNGDITVKANTPEGEFTDTIPEKAFRELIAPALEGTPTTPGREVSQRPPTTAQAAGVPKCTTPQLSAFTEEFSDEDIAECRRLDALHRSLSKSDRLYIVERWDDEQGLESPHKRLEHKRAAPVRLRQRRTWAILALIPAILFWWWLSGLIQRDSKRNTDSNVLEILRDHSKDNPGLKSAIEQADKEDQEYIESQRPEPDEP